MQNLLIALVMLVLTACGRTEMHGFHQHEDTAPRVETVYVEVDGGVRTVTETEYVEVPVYVDAGSQNCENDNCECYDLSRTEFAQMLMETLIDLDQYQVAQDTPRYADVPEDHPNFTAIMAAAEMGFLLGTQDSEGNLTFGAEDYINRAEATKVIIEAINGLDDFQAPDEPTFVDVVTDVWYFNPVEAAASKGLTQGYYDAEGQPTGRFGPEDLASSCFTRQLLSGAGFERGKIAMVHDNIVHAHRIAIEGHSELLSASYRLFGTSPTNPLNTITVVNRPYGGDIQPTMAIRTVWLDCMSPAGQGAYIAHSAELVNGRAVFSNLNCYHENGGELPVQLAYDVANLSELGASLSGAVFRLVMEGAPLLDSQDRVPTNTVRRTRPTFGSEAQTNTTLANGVNNLLAFNVTAHPNGSLGIARMTFQVTAQDADGGGELGLSEFRFYRNGVLIPDAHILDGDLNDLTGATQLVGDKVMVTFSQEEVVSADVTVTYQLRATVNGMEGGDRIFTSLAYGDYDSPVMGKSAGVQPNTARIVSSIATQGLFAGEPFFRASTSSDRNLIWSDHSADAHVYSVADSGSSADWTNGHSVVTENIVWQRN